MIILCILFRRVGGVLSWSPHCPLHHFRTGPSCCATSPGRVCNDGGRPIIKDGCRVSGRDRFVLNTPLIRRLMSEWRHVGQSCQQQQQQCRLQAGSIGLNLSVVYLTAVCLTEWRACPLCVCPRVWSKWHWPAVVAVSW